MLRLGDFLRSRQVDVCIWLWLLGLGLRLGFGSFGSFGLAEHLPTKKTYVLCKRIDRVSPSPHFSGRNPSYLGNSIGRFDLIMKK